MVIIIIIIIIIKVDFWRRSKRKSRIEKIRNDTGKANIDLGMEV